MSFDEEVEKLKQELASERAPDPARGERAAMLDRMRGLLEQRIASKRVEFRFDDGGGVDDEPSVLVLYAASGDEFGAVFYEDGLYTFESDDDDYFADVPETDNPREFVDLLYESLKIGLPAYELDMGEE